MWEWLQSVVVPKIKDSQAQLLDPYVSVICLMMCEMFVLAASRYVNHSSFTDEPELQNLNPG